jgi:hypothetical protein
MTTLDIIDFHNYVASFYMPGRNPIYPFEGLTMKDIIKATTQHINDLTEHQEFCADSIDREAVARILCEDYGYSYP